MLNLFLRFTDFYNLFLFYRFLLGYNFQYTYALHSESRCLYD
nr:MAG TPA: hypothetical protein [Caudoviricetes sp.]